MGSVAINDWGVTILDLTGMVHDDDLSLEGLNLFAWVVLGITGHIASLDVLH